VAKSGVTEKELGFCGEWLEGLDTRGCGAVSGDSWGSFVSGSAPDNAYGSDAVQMCLHRHRPPRFISRRLRGST
jgi:hypothetical protein